MFTTDIAEQIYTQIRAKLELALEPEQLTIRDDSHKHKGHNGYNPDGASHLHIRIVASTFYGMSRIDRYRKVYNLLVQELNTHIHALQLDLRTPEEVKEYNHR
jgi:BolA protein